MDRRQFLALAGLGAGAAALGTAPARAARVATAARIVIIGAGAAGTALANRLVERLDGARIILVDPRREHVYQPGLSLVAAGLKPASYVMSQTAHWLPSGVEWMPDAVEAVDAQAKTVTTRGGETLAYDWLVVAPGLVLDHDAIEGFSLDMVGENGIGALYAGPDYAAKTWAAVERFTQSGGRGLFTRPATEMKCAGAPLKHTFLVDDLARRAGNRGRSEIVYAAQNDTLFGVPIVSEKVRMLFRDRGIETVYSHVLRAVDEGAKRATFTTPNGDVVLDYDYLHVVPPQRAPDFVRRSGLSWADKVDRSGLGRGRPEDPAPPALPRDLSRSATSPACPRARRRRA